MLEMGGGEYNQYMLSSHSPPPVDIHRIVNFEIHLNYIKSSTKNKLTSNQ